MDRGSAASRRSPRGRIAAVGVVMAALLSACSGPPPAASGPVDTAAASASPSGSSAPIGSPSAAPVVSPTATLARAGRIAFAQIVPSVEHFDVFTILPDGTDEQKLVHGKHTLPRWSPDGTKVAMSSYWFGNYESTVNADSSSFVEYQNPDPTLTLECTTWSADGKRLACDGFDPKKPARNGIYTVDATTGQDLQRLTTSPDGAREIPGSYSPDGTQIVYVRATYTVLSLGQLWVVNADGSGAHKISDTLVGYRVAWSPDGDSIVADDAKGHLILFDLHHLGEQPVQISIPNAKASVPRWSPDGTRLVFLLDRGAAGSDIYTVALDGSELTRVTTNAVNDGAPDWGPATP
jgi:Tol biopolymer transport system component